MIKWALNGHRNPFAIHVENSPPPLREVSATGFIIGQVQYVLRQPEAAEAPRNWWGGGGDLTRKGTLVSKINILN
jgi:hypothetical protein